MHMQVGSYSFVKTPMPSTEQFAYGLSFGKQRVERFYHLVHIVCFNCLIVAFKGLGFRSEVETLED